MDIFTEQIVQKKKTASDHLLSAGICLLAIVVIILAMPYLYEFDFIFAAAVIWGAYMLIRSRNIEYEYSVTNGEMDVDRITNRSRRKRLLTVDAREIEILAPKSHERFARDLANQTVKKVKACSSMDAENLYFLIYYSDGERNMLLFEPTKKIIDAFRTYAPSKVYQL